MSVDGNYIHIAEKEAGEPFSYRIKIRTLPSKDVSLIGMA